MTGIRVKSFGSGDARREREAFWVWIAPHIALAVDRSFVEANMKNPPFEEIKDRTLKAEKIVKLLKFDFHWSPRRIADRLPGLLRAELLKMKNTVEDENKRGMFAPDHASASAVQDPPKLAPEIKAAYAREFGDTPEGEELTDLAGPLTMPRIVDTTDDES